MTAPRITFHGRSFLALLVLLSLGGLAVLFLRRPFVFVPLASLLTALQFGLLPWLARRRCAVLDREILAALPARRGDELLARWGRSWLVRFYGPTWYLPAKEGLLRMSLGQDDRAEPLLLAALEEAPDAELPVLEANLTRVELRLGKVEQARRRRARLARVRPDLVEELELGEAEDPGRR